VRLARLNTFSGSPTCIRPLGGFLSGRSISQRVRLRAGSPLREWIKGAIMADAGLFKIAQGGDDGARQRHPKAMRG
jgi:hypothetical protein